MNGSNSNLVGIYITPGEESLAQRKPLADGEIWKWNGRPYSKGLQAYPCATDPDTALLRESLQLQFANIILINGEVGCTFRRKTRKVI